MADQIEFKLLPKFRGLDLTEANNKRAMQRIKDLLGAESELNDQRLVRAIRDGANGRAKASTVPHVGGGRPLRGRGRLMADGVLVTPQPLLATAPWSAPLPPQGGGPAGGVLRGRVCVLVPPEADQVFASNCREILPLLGFSPGPDGRPWKRFELPAFGLSAEEAAEYEDVELTVVGPTYGRSTVRVRLADTLVRFTGDDGTPAASPDRASPPRGWLRRSGGASPGLRRDVRRRPRA